jgi:hypothetical protein
MLWQGGFLFYALVVVPVGGSVLGNETLQGFVTQRVTVWLNLLGAASLALLSLDAILHRPLRALRVAVVIVSWSLLASLFAVHDRLDALLDAEYQIVTDSAAFYPLHAVYLVLSGVQWAVMLAAAWLMLAAWRKTDATPARLP